MASRPRPRALLVAGDPSPGSRSAALLEAAGRVLSGHDFEVNRLDLPDLPPGPPVPADLHDPVTRETRAAVAGAQAIVFGWPACNAAHGSPLQAFLDRLEPDALAGRWTWTVTGDGCAAHPPAADHPLQAVLEARGGLRRVPAVHATPAQVVRADGAVNATLAIEIAHRLHAGAAQLAAAIEGERQLRRLRATAAVTATPAPGPRCSA